MGIRRRVILVIFKEKMGCGEFGGVWIRLELRRGGLEGVAGVELGELGIAAEAFVDPSGTFLQNKLQLSIL